MSDDIKLGALEFVPNDFSENFLDKFGEKKTESLCNLVNAILRGKIAMAPKVYGNVAMQGPDYWCDHGTWSEDPDIGNSSLEPTQTARLICIEDLK